MSPSDLLPLDIFVSRCAACEGTGHRRCHRGPTALYKPCPWCGGVATLGGYVVRVRITNRIAADHETRFFSADFGAAIVRQVKLAASILRLGTWRNPVEVMALYCPAAGAPRVVSRVKVACRARVDAAAPGG